MEHETAGNAGSAGHKRRIHYSGKYPKNYNEKYKELKPEQYETEVLHVLEKGNTPAGTHIPIMAEEILRFLRIVPGQKGLDATLGYGGHSLKILEQLNHTGHLWATDADPIEIEKTGKRLAELGYGEDCFTARHINFSELDMLKKEAGAFDFVLADLGVSSMQIDNPERGFTYKADGPLDLRMDPGKGLTAAERLKELSRDELAGMLRDNADEPYAEEIAETVSRDLKHGMEIATTFAFRDEILKAVAGKTGKLPEKERKDAVKKTLARSFQALRIDVNAEYEALYAFLEKLPDATAPGARIAILTFHSGEDRLVKKSFKELYGQGIYKEIAEEALRPSAEECIRNSRAHSAKLRYAVRA